MHPNYYPLVNIGIAVLIALVSIPLIFRRVPMNPFYGIRFPESYKSDKSWYAINEFGGKALFLASLPILISGLWGCFANPRNYLIIGTAIMVISLTAGCVVSYIKARVIDKKMANEPMDRITMPSALLAFRLRSRLGCRKQVVIGHRGR